MFYVLMLRFGVGFLLFYVKILTEERETHGHRGEVRSILLANYSPLPPMENREPFSRLVNVLRGFDLGLVCR